MTRLFRSVRYALRLYAKSPAFTATALTVLAVGIGINVAVFTLLNVLLLKPIGGTADVALVSLAAVDRAKPGSYEGFSYTGYRLVRDAAPVAFSSVLAQRFTGVGVTEDGSTRRTFAAAVSANYFATLGASPLVGRPFVREEEESPTAAVAVASYSYWRAHGLSAGLLGKSVRINGRDFAIVGVMPQGFSGTMALFSPEFWVPLRALDGSAANTRPGADAATASGQLHLVGRLRPGGTRGQLPPLLATVAARLNSGTAGTPEWSIAASPVSRFSTGSGGPGDGEMTGVMLFLLGLSLTVLLIATLNLANMLLARGTARQREVGIRLALGARPSQVMGQLVVEALVLAAAGGALGLGIATAAVRLLAVRIAPSLPFALAIDPWPDLRVVLATMAFAGISAVFFGLGPAWRLVRTDVVPQLKGGTGATTRSRRYRVRNLLVASQLAMSLALLSAAALFVRGAWQATTADPGFTLERGIVATVDPSLAGYDEQRSRDLYRRALDRLRAMPGVERASVASIVPFGLASEVRSVRRPERSEEVQWGTFTVVGSDYFQTLHLRVLRGREFTRAEEEGGTPGVAIVDETLARRLWPDGNALGQSVQFSDDATRWERPLQVVGIVPAVRHSLFDTHPDPHVYVPLGATYRAEMALHVRVRTDSPAGPDRMLQQVRSELLAVDPRLPILSVRTLAQHRDGSLYMWIAQGTARLFTAFALAALGLAMLGVYGVKAFLVARRTREIGIRVALGASHADILRLVVGDSVRLVASGLAAGFFLSVALSRLLTGWVYGLGGTDAAAPVVAALLLTASGILASAVPARRAMKIAPSLALRQE